jgi:hypothetical protein
MAEIEAGPFAHKLVAVDGRGLVDDDASIKAGMLRPIDPPNAQTAAPTSTSGR